MKYTFLLLSLFAFNFIIAQDIEPELPEVVVSEFDDYELKRSVINIPLSMNLKEVEKKINQEFSGTIYEDLSFDGDDVKVRVTKKPDKSATVVGKGQDLYLNIPLHIWAEVRIKKDLLIMQPNIKKSTEFDIDVKYTINLELQEDWDIETEARGDFAWEKKPKIQLGPIKVPIAGIAKPHIQKQIDEIALTINEYVQKDLNIQDKVSKFWKKLGEPILVDPASKAWLSVEPTQFFATQLNTIGNTTHLQVGLESYLINTLGDKPETITLGELPPLTLVDSLPNEFSILLQNRVSYESLKALTLEEVKADPISFKKGKYKVYVTDLEYWGSKERLFIRADIQAKKRKKKGYKDKVKGYLVFDCIPYFDKDDNTIKVKDLDFELKTKSALIKMANWMLHGKIKKQMEKNIVVPIEDELQGAKDLVNKELENLVLEEFVNIKGNLERLEIDAIFPGDQGIDLYIMGYGDVRTEIKF